MSSPQTTHGGIASQPWGTWRAAARPSRWRARRQHKSTSGPFSLALPPPTPHTHHPKERHRITEANRP
eukprot:scaffold55529_cov30-Phaeocystis_antarctica.AAC.1